jgi:glycosyltransferase involved in cell wall biosynthesis
VTVSTAQPSALPLVTVVTPVLNGATFISATIDSVLAQDYSNVEYLIIDGGSSDGTETIARAYGERIRYVRERDAGQADAVNRGFRMGAGSVLAFLNADDVYAPDAVTRGVTELGRRPDTSVVYGRAALIDDRGRQIGRYPVESFDPALLAERCFIAQPATFIRREAFDAVGGFDPRLHFAFDYDFWIRLSRSHRFAMIDAVLASARVHRGSKTISERRRACAEAVRMLAHHFGYVPYGWMYALSDAILKDRGRRFEKVLLSLVLGIAENRRTPVRYVDDWISYRGFAKRR